MHDLILCVCVHLKIAHGIKIAHGQIVCAVVSSGRVVFRYENFEVNVLY